MSQDRCEPDVFENGIAVAMMDTSPETAEELVALTAAATGQKVDWFYAGGRVVIKAGGDHDVVRKFLRRLFVAGGRIIEANGEQTKVYIGASMSQPHRLIMDGKEMVCRIHSIQPFFTVPVHEFTSSGIEYLGLGNVRYKVEGLFEDGGSFALTCEADPSDPNPSVFYWPRFMIAYERENQ